MITTKSQLTKIRNSNVGYGWIVLNSGNGEVSEIEVYVSKENKLLRVGNGKPLFPVSICDEDEGMIEVN